MTLIRLYSRRTRLTITFYTDTNDKYLADNPRYTIRNSVTNKEYVVDVTHIRPINYDSAYITPLNIAVKDTDEIVVNMIVHHDPLDPVVIPVYWKYQRITNYELRITNYEL